MISKDQLLASMLHECDTCIHLFTKLPANAADYRPTPGQRSTLDLLRYLSVVAIASTECMAAGNWDGYAAFSERAKAMPYADFPAAMARQKKELQAFFDGTDEKTLLTQEAEVPGGSKMPLGAAIINGPFKWITAYKLQLFLYAKSCGATELATANAWAGRDPKPKA